MEPEKEIVNWWLNRNGFFTLNNIKAAQNKEIGTLALNLGQKGSQIQHIEVNCSVSNPRNLTLDKSSPETSVEKYTLKKFENEIIIKKVKESIKELTGEEKEYQRAIVLGNLALTNRGKIISLLKKRGYTVYKFEDILTDVMHNLDKQNYQSATVRNLQLIKHILLSEPKALATLLNKKGKQDILNQNSRETFLKAFLKDVQNQKIIQKELNEDIIIALLKNSSLKRPEKLAKVLASEVLGERSGKKFLETLEKHGFKKRKIKKKRERSLLSFLK